MLVDRIHLRQFLMRLKTFSSVSKLLESLGVTTLAQPKNRNTGHTHSSIGSTIYPCEKGKDWLLRSSSPMDWADICSQ